MNVRAYHHIPENRGITVSTPAMTEDFVLDVTLANILVIDGQRRGQKRGLQGRQDGHRGRRLER